jgi:transcriptional regulator with XRE-family HTH domain
VSEVRSRYRPPGVQDREVCDRIRRCRIDSHYSQKALAGDIGLTRNQLNRIERKQVAPRFLPAWRFCRLLNINPLWLAYGPVFDGRGYTDMPVDDIPPSALFTAVMQDQRFRSRLPSAPRPEPQRSRRSLIAMSFDDFLRHVVRPWKSFLRPTETPRFFNYMVCAAQEYFAHRDLDSFTVKSYLADMTAIPLSWATLKRRLRRATQKPKAKAELARRFKVTTAAVSQWLSPNSLIAPKADTALQLLEWVAAEEAQQKQSAGVSEAPARKTRGKSSYEKPSDRKKN